MNDSESHDRLLRLRDALGEETRDVAVGREVIRLAGLHPALAEQLERRWGGFIGPRSGEAPRRTLHLYDAGTSGWLDAPAPAEIYRIEALNDAERRVVASYNFAIAREADEGEWRAGLTRQDGEPLERVVENIVRFVTACVALESGGFAMHAAGVLRDGEAFIFAGPSGSGKSTATRLARPATSLGDDFALVVPERGGWVAPALPFDNSERIASDAVRGVYPVRGIWRLVQSDETRVETPSTGMAVASLMGCVAFPRTMPEMADRLLGQVRRFVAECRFGRLHFSLSEALWPHLVRNFRSRR
jgi:hypothetical protein